ncbi:hypothetical protein T261_0147 [Streptomyces lydicus]|nr:hypothetical protein T261_0147 [Streptomyces lydicus]
MPLMITSIGLIPRGAGSTRLTSARRPHGDLHHAAAAS